jgi:hypothetical protein
VDPLPVRVKATTRTGVKVYGQARRLGMTASLAEAGSKGQILDGYILRAVRLLESYNVYILDPAAILLFSGYALDARNELGTVGNRDEFSSKKKTKATYVLSPSEASDPRLFLPVPAMPPEEADSAPTVYCQVFQPQLYDSGLMAIGYRRVPMALISSVAQMDTYDHFTYNQRVSIGLALTAPQFSMGKSLDQLRKNYLSLNTFWFSESQMSDGWSLQSRRLVNQTQYATSSPYFGRYLPKSLIASGAIVPASDNDGTDHYIMAAEAVRQSRATWQINADTYYDLMGERALLLVRGTIDRRDYDADEPVVLRARLDSATYVRTSDLPREDIKPYPTTYYGFPATDETDRDPSTNPPPVGVPALPAYSWWLNPQVARYSDQFGTEGFATFCVYWAPNHRLSGQDNTQMSWGRLHAYMATAIVVIDGDNKARVLKADRNDANYADSGFQPIDGAEADKFVNPWLVGVESIPRTDTEGVVRRTAYALVWEEWQSRGAGLRLVADYPPGATRVPSGTASIGGEFVLYSIGPDGLSRTVLSGDNCAAMMHPNMGPRFYFPVANAYSPPPGDRSEAWFTDRNGYGACRYMGNDKLVTACIPNEIYSLYTQFAPDGGAYGLNQEVDPHVVSCAVIDAVTGVVEIRGEIAERIFADQFCTITCAQMGIAAQGDKQERPAVLLAGFHTNIKAYFSDYEPPPDCTYLSIDGGWNWRLYVEDASGENGQFLVGNQLWTNDPATRVDTGEKAK